MNVAKLIIVVIIVGTLTISTGAWVLSQEPPEAIRLAINAALCWFLYQGKSWARWTMGVLHALAGIFGLIASSEAKGDTATPLLIMGSFYAVAALLLLSGWFVKEHFD